jgi:glycosyltransferase involved in cell wall biosynthesis
VAARPVNVARGKDVTDSSVHGAAKDSPPGLTVGAARACVIIPAYEAEKTVGKVIDELRGVFADATADDILVVDDGSSDGTGLVAREHGARVVRQPRNLGKGAALVRGFEEASALGYDVALTVDADGQHPAASAREVLTASRDPRVLVLGIRNLVKEGAPRANRFSNGISNFFLSSFTHRRLLDTQCGLRRYPVRETLALGRRARGYAFEAEILLRASAAGIVIVQKEVPVLYPPEDERMTHFHSVRDPIRIIATVLATVRDISVERRSRGR